MKSESKRNITLDLLKFISAFFVIFVHVPFHGTAGRMISSLSRFAVPVFFLTSGYFCYKNDDKKILKKLKRILLIFILSSVLYNLTNLFFAFVNREGLEYFSRFVSLKGWINFFIFNVPFSATRLWFLLSLVYVYLIQYLLVKFKIKNKFIFLFSALLLIVNVVAVELIPIFCKLFSNSSYVIPEHYTRNFFFTGYPFFAIGMYIKACFKEKNKFTPTLKNYVFMVAIGILCSICSFFFIGDRVLTIGACIISISAFLLSLCLKDIRYSNKLTKLFDCNLNIYIFHRPVENFISIILGFIIVKDTAIFHNILTLLVCGLTLVFSLILNFFVSFLKRKNVLKK